MFLTNQLYRSEVPMTPYFSSVQSLSHVQLFGTPWTAARPPWMTNLLEWLTLTTFSSAQFTQSCPTLATAWTPPCQASLLITNYQSLLKLMSNESVMPSNHLILCRPLLLPPSIFPSIRVFSSESVLRIRWPKY